MGTVCVYPRLKDFFDLTETSVCTFTIFTSTILTQFLPGVTVVPREFEDNGYARFWRLRKVHYGPSENGEFPPFFLTILFVILVVHSNKFRK